MSGFTGYRGLARNASLTEVIEHLNRTEDGHINVTLAVTLVANAASTLITDARIGIRTALLFMPQTAHAAAELAAGTLYVPAAAILKGSATLSHANNAQADRTFIVVIIG